MIALEMLDKLFRGMGRTYRGMHLPTFTRPHTGIRQGKRLARQMAAGRLDFSASERCIAAIKERERKFLAGVVAKRMDAPITRPGRGQARAAPP